MNENRDVNLTIEDLKGQIVNAINQSGLPISVAYYVTKDIMAELEINYRNYLSQAYRQEGQAAAANQDTEENIPQEPIIED